MVKQQRTEACQFY